MPCMREVVTKFLGVFWRMQAGVGVEECIFFLVFVYVLSVWINVSIFFGLQGNVLRLGNVSRKS